MSIESLKTEFETAKALLDLLISRATGKAADPHEYERLRRGLLSNPITAEKLPSWVAAHRTLDSFWEFIKYKPGYGERRAFLNKEFLPLLDATELNGIKQLQKQSVVDNSIERHTISENRQRVFVVHGRNEEARSALFDFLRAIGLHPLEWSEIVRETGESAPYVGQVLETGFRIVQAVVVLMTPDDEARLRKQYWSDNEPSEETRLVPQPRPNVLIEAGMALGLFPKRTVIVELGRIRAISDILGRHVIRMNNSTERRQELARRLETAGCSVNLLGTDWHRAGKFDIALENCSQSDGRDEDSAIAISQTTLQYMNGLSADELYRVAIALSNNTQTVECGHSDYVAASLVHKGLLERIPFESRRKLMDVPHLFPNSVWAHLCKNKESIIERAVAANTDHEGRLRNLGKRSEN